MEESKSEYIENENLVSEIEGTWQVLHKDNEGVGHVTTLRKHSTKKRPIITNPEWPPANRVESVRLKRFKPRQLGSTALKRTVILPDLQLPHVDSDALNVALQITEVVKPDEIVFLGDVVDLASYSKYIQRPEFAEQGQIAINELHLVLAGLRLRHRRAKIAVLAANHEKRLPDYFLQNAKAAYNLRRADDPTGWPVMSIPHLAAFDKLDVDYIDGYPANRYWINERLQIKHGTVTKPSGQTARAVAQNERVSTIFGHSHRIENYFQTHNVYGGGRANAAFNIGCLCLLDGSVPGVNSGVNQLDGSNVENYANWQHGMAVVESEPGDGSFNVEQIYINTFDNYRTSYRGKLYKPYDWSLDGKAL